jgi:hypothetical protein
LARLSRASSRGSIAWTAAYEPNYTIPTGRIPTPATITISTAHTLLTTILLHHSISKQTYPQSSRTQWILLRKESLTAGKLVGGYGEGQIGSLAAVGVLICVFFAV